MIKRVAVATLTVIVWAKGPEVTILMSLNRQPLPGKLEKGLSLQGSKTSIVKFSMKTYLNE